MSAPGSSPPPRPLVGVTILDLTNVLAGPFACQQLAHLGADVIKVEMVGRGDLARSLGADPELAERGMGVSFLAQNAGKRSATVNLKDERGRALFLRLVATADVVVENFRPGVMDRLDVGYEVLRSVREDLVYCAISGFGQTGPMRGRPAYDQIIQGVSGLMSITGEAGGPHYRAGFPVADTIGGLTAAMAIAAALNRRPRGAFIDVSMLESVLATMGWVVSNHLMAGVTPAANGNENMTSAPSGTFRTGDGLLNIAANREEQWQRLIEHLDRPELLDDPRYRTRRDRLANREELRQAIEIRLAEASAAEWSERLNAVGVPAGVVQGVDDALAMAQVAEADFIQTFDDAPGVGRPVAGATNGLRIDGVRPTVESPPPRLGEHNREVWTGVGCTPEDVDRLERDGVL